VVEAGTILITMKIILNIGRKIPKKNMAVGSSKSTPSFVTSPVTLISNKHLLISICFSLQKAIAGVTRL
jgi:hypothetical protein